MQTQLCRYYEAGECRLGSECPFAHGLGELRRPQPPAMAPPPPPPQYRLAPQQQQQQHGGYGYPAAGRGPAPGRGMGGGRGAAAGGLGPHRNPYYKVRAGVRSWVASCVYKGG